MEKCEYQPVTTTNEKLHDDVISWKYFFRQITLASAVWTQYFTAGLCMGTPTVLIPQWVRENNVTIDDEMQSWIYACPAFCATPLMLITPTLSTYVGRKIPYIMSSLSMVIVFSILYFSTSIKHILLSEALQGFAHACNVTITLLVITEYVNPKYRGIFLTIKSASFFWGIWAANAIGTFCHWRYIPIAGLLCTVYSFAGVFHPESPHWLASKGKFEKARTAFRWLHGRNERSEKELEAIIESQASKTEGKKSWRSFVAIVKTRLFYLPLSLALLMAFQYHFSGKLVYSMYAVDVMKKVTGDEATAYTGMLILDGVTVFGMYMGSILSKYLKRRTLFMHASFMGVSHLFILASYLYLVKFGVIPENNVLAIIMLTVYSIAISCGPMMLSMSISGEIIPMRYQAICFTLQATLFSVAFTLLLKFSPLIFNTLGMEGSFLFYGVTSGISLAILYFYLPETKDKTLLEIEEYFKERKEENEVALKSLKSSDERTE